MKNLIFSFFWITLIACKNEGSPIGKTYKAEVSASYAKTINDGCMFYTDCILIFKEEIVTIIYNGRRNCSHDDFTGNNTKPIKGINYKWKLEKDIIHIYDFNEYGGFKIEKTKLVARKKMNETYEKLDFNQVK